MVYKQLDHFDLAQNELRNAVTQNLASAPSSPKPGQRYFDTTLELEGYYNGTLWVYTGAGTGSLTSILKGNGSGGFASAVAGTDYLAPTGNGSGLSGLTQSQISGLVAALAALAPLASPALTGSPTAPTPTTSTGIANKAYVDSTAQGLDAKPSAKVVATSNLTLSGTQTIDGVSCGAGDRVLATGQSTASQNGLWVVASGAWTRPADFASASSQQGAYVFIEGGTAGASSGWVLTGTSAVTVDTTSQTWTQFSGAGEITPGTGLSKSGNVISLATPVSSANGGAGTVSGSLKADGSGNVSAASYDATIGDGSSTSITVTHSLGTRNVHVTVYDASTYDEYGCGKNRATTNTVVLTFGTAPALNALCVHVSL